MKDSIIHDGQAIKLATTLTLGAQAQQVIDTWRSSIEYGFPEEITDAFGEDLAFIFGPKESRIPVSQLPQEDYDRKMDIIKRAKIPALHVNKGKLILEHLGAVDFITAFTQVLRSFQKIIDPETGKNVLYGLQLGNFDLDEAVMSGIPVHVRFIKLNMKAQREIALDRIFKLLCNFDSSLVFGAKGRFASAENKVYGNDGNHGTVALVFHGVLTPPVGFSLKELTYIDFNQFIACNGDVLPITDYDIHKNRVNRAKAMLAESMPVKKEDEASYFLDKVLTNCDVTLIANAADPGPGETNLTSQFQKHFKTYCKNEYKNREVFEKALKIVRQAWPGGSVDHAPVWGLIELLNSQNPKTRTDATMVAIAEILAEKWASSQRVLAEVNSQLKVQFPQKEKSKYTVWKDHRYTNTGNRGLMIAAAIKTLIENHEAWIRSQPGRKKGFNLKLDPVISNGGQLFEMDMPYTSSECVKNFSTFKPSAIDATTVISNTSIGTAVEDEEADLAMALDEFENAE
jgi:hypothetical protein